MLITFERAQSLHNALNTTIHATIVDIEKHIRFLFLLNWMPRLQDLKENSVAIVAPSQGFVALKIPKVVFESSICNVMLMLWV